MQPEPIYLDHNSTAPLDPDVLEVMRPYFLAAGNAESRHAFGRAARRAYENARETTAEILGADPAEVIFTSGGTEANNLAVFGLAGAESSPGHVVSSPIEHAAIAEPVARLEAAGFVVDRLPINDHGVAVIKSMSELVRPTTRFATLMLANNETGAIQPVHELAKLAIDRNIPVHTDAVQAVGRIPVHFHNLGVTTLAASAHKFHGPMGIGILLLKSGVRLGSRLFGGGQQQGRRPGTVPIPLAVGLAAALKKWHDQAVARSTHWRDLRDRLEHGLATALGPGHVIRNGPVDDQQRLPQTVNLAFPGIDGDALLIQLDLAGVAVSLGSACASGSTRPSPALIAMRVPDDRLRSSVRLSLGATTSANEIEQAVVRIARVARSLLELQTECTSRETLDF
jgi:cysteine desulfurase